MNNQNNLTNKQKRALKESLDGTIATNATKNLLELVLALEDIEVASERLEKNAWQFIDKDGNIVKYRCSYEIYY